MNKTRYSIFFIFILLLGGLFSCATIPKANQAIGQIRLGYHEKAWQMVSAELKNPTVSSQEDLCELNLATVQILENIITYEFAPPNPDEIAKKSYDYVLTNCQAFKKKVMATENQYGMYFLNTRRPGTALPHFKRSLKLSKKGSFENMMNEHNIALCYADMGKFELRDFHRIAAIQVGKAYFKTRRTYKYSTDEFNEWNNFYKVLQLRMDELSWGENAQDNLSEMHELWNEIESINKKWVSVQTRYIAYVPAAQRFASAGDTAFASKLYNNAKELVERYPHKNVEGARLAFQTLEADILSAEGQLKDAAALYKDWIERFQIVSGRSLSGNDYRIAGLAQESAGNYDLSIKYLENSIAKFEEVRSSFKVKSRGRVLSGLFVTPYWGLMRSHASRYLKHRSEKDFKGAIRAAQKLRARQFGELLGISHWIEGDIDITKLQLKPDELLLNIVLTNRAIILFAISSKWHDLFMIPYDKDSFNDNVKRVKAQISTPGDTSTLFNDLKSISKIVLKPIEGKLERFSKLTIIPDGTLNGIPFTLLSKSYKHYRPLILDHEVSLTPSLSYLIKNRKLDYRATSDKLFGLADPDYGSIAVPEAYQDETKGFYKRAVENFNLFTPLPETRTEVVNIARLFQSDSVTTVYGKEASESKIKSLNLEEYRYLHFATHGILGNQIPGVDEPALVLAAEPENSAQDGFLTLSEVEEMKLNSEIAVLSACDTGSGKYFTGEGIMGLSRGFLLAGSRSVIVSLWPVASEATVELMTLFYQNLRSGKSKEDSLRLAQLAMMDSKNVKAYRERSIKITDRATSGTHDIHPFYWAPFVMIGE